MPHINSWLCSLREARSSSEVCMNKRAQNMAQLLSKKINHTPQSQIWIANTPIFLHIVI